MSGAGQAAMVGACAGGIIASVAAACLAATGQRDRLAALVLLVTVLDTAKAGTAGALVNPPGNPKTHYQANSGAPADAEDWLRTAETQQGSWWPDLLAWLGDRCGKQEPAPNALGGGLRPISDAPGTYVFDT